VNAHHLDAQHGDTPVTDAIPAVTAEVFEYHGVPFRVFFMLLVLTASLAFRCGSGRSPAHGAPRRLVARDPAPVLTDRPLVSVWRCSWRLARMLSYASTAGSGCAPSSICSSAEWFGWMSLSSDVHHAAAHCSPRRPER